MLKIWQCLDSFKVARDFTGMRENIIGQNERFWCTPWQEQSKLDWRTLTVGIKKETIKKIAEFLSLFQAKKTRTLLYMNIDSNPKPK